MIPSVRFLRARYFKRVVVLAAIASAVFPSTVLVFGQPSPTRTSQKLKVSADRRHLEREDGTPFLYLGDTAWELFHRLNREEADRYLADRSRKGFTVIQAVALSELDGIGGPNAYGDLPLLEKDPARPNEPYFRHVDYIVDKAGELGLHIGFLPSWGSYWKEDGGKTIFNEANAASYGRFLGRRYRDKPLIWILGGDNNPTTDRERRVIEALAAGLKRETAVITS